MRLAAGENMSGVLLVLLSAAGFGAMPIFARYAYADGANLYGVLRAYPVVTPIHYR